MKKILNGLILAVVFAIVYFVLRKIFAFILMRMHIDTFWTITLLFSFFISFYLVALTYKSLWDFDALKQAKKSILFVAFFIISMSIISYITWIDHKSRILYNYTLSDTERGWLGKVHKANDTLGFEPIPDAYGYHTFPVGKNIPMHYNKEGFRVPVNGISNFSGSEKTDILFLGCSFTYGDACLAEETFSYLVAKKNHFNYINAGVCGYGLSQMVLLAERLIPKYKPSYVVLQYSPWLIDRSSSFFAPTYIGTVTNPYFTKKDKEYSIEYPDFSSQVFSINKKLYQEIYKGKYLKFLFEVGIPFYLKESYLTTRLMVKNLFGKVPSPTKERKEVERFAYNKMSNLARKYNTKVIILNLGDLEYTRQIKSIIKPGDNIRIADADSLLNEYLITSKTRNYEKEFGHWRFDGKDTVLVDEHPNAKAHSIIANSINLKIN